MKSAPYRGQDIGGRRNLENFCLQSFLDGRADQLLEILPHISLLRCNSFVKPLSALLGSPDRGKQLFAVLALGSLGAKESVEQLLVCFKCPRTLQGPGSHALQTAIILALGETGERRAVAALEQILECREQTASWATQRRNLVATSLGTLLHFDVEEALEPLLRLADSPIPSVRAHVVTELGVAYWHRPQTTPVRVINRLETATEDFARDVYAAAVAALYNLAELGCSRAERFFRQSEKRLA